MENLFRNKIEFFEADGEHQPYVVIHVTFKQDVFLVKLSTRDYYKLKPHQGARIGANPDGRSLHLVIRRGDKVAGLLSTVYGTVRNTYFTYLNGDRADLRRENIISGKRAANTKPTYSGYGRKKIQITDATPAMISACIKDDLNQSFAELVEHVAGMKNTYVEETRAYLEELRQAGQLGYFDDYHQLIRWEGKSC